MSFSGFALAVYAPPVPTPGPSTGQFDPSLPDYLQSPFAPYAGALTLTYYEDIRPPSGIVHTPPPVLGIDLAGGPIVRGYGTMSWSYEFLRSDEWYYLSHILSLGRRSGRFCRISWPDPQSGTVSDASARIEPVTGISRAVGGMSNLTLTFSHLGIDDNPNSPPNGIYLPSRSLEGGALVARPL